MRIPLCEESIQPGILLITGLLQGLKLSLSMLRTPPAYQPKTKPASAGIYKLKQRIDKRSNSGSFSQYNQSTQ